MYAHFTVELLNYMVAFVVGSLFNFHTNGTCMKRIGIEDKTKTDTGVGERYDCVYELHSPICVETGDVPGDQHSPFIFLMIMCRRLWWH